MHYTDHELRDGNPSFGRAAVMPICTFNVFTGNLAFKIDSTETSFPDHIALVGQLSIYLGCLLRMRLDVWFESFLKKLGQNDCRSGITLGFEPPKLKDAALSANPQGPIANIG
jgi:hypothetical protein